MRMNGIYNVLNRLPVGITRCSEYRREQRKKRSKSSINYQGRCGRVGLTSLSASHEFRRTDDHVVEWSGCPACRGKKVRCSVILGDFWDSENVLRAPFAERIDSGVAGVVGDGSEFESHSCVASEGTKCSLARRISDFSEGDHARWPVWS